MNDRPEEAQIALAGCKFLDLLCALELDAFQMQVKHFALFILGTNTLLLLYLLLLVLIFFFFFFFN